MAALAFLTISDSALACSGKSYAWKPTDTGGWANAQNWEPAGVPGKDDSVTIESPGANYDEAEVTDASGTVCDLTLTGSDAYLEVPTGTLQVTDQLTWSGASEDHPSEITGSITTPKASLSGVTQLASGTLDVTGSLGVQGHVDLFGSKLQSDASANVAGTISSGQSSEGDGNSKFEVHGGLALGGDLAGPGLDLNLAPNASADLHGHTATLDGLSFSRWGDGAQIADGTVDFSGGTLLADGAVTVAGGAQVKLEASAALADGTWFGAGSPATLKGAGQLEWGQADVLGDVTLASGFHTVLDGDSERHVSSDATLPIGHLTNAGDMTIAAGSLLVGGDPAQFVNRGTVALAPGAALGGESTMTQPAIVNDSGATLSVEQAAGTTPTATIQDGSILNRGTIAIPAGEQLIYDGSNFASTLAGGGTLRGGGTFQLTGGTHLDVRGTTTVQDGTQLWLNGDDELDGGSGGVLSGTGTLHWSAGTVGGHVSTQGSLATLIDPSGTDVGHYQDAGVLELGHAAQIAGTSVGMLSGAELDIDAPLTADGTAAGFAPQSEPPGPGTQIVIGANGSVSTAATAVSTRLDTPTVNHGRIDLSHGTLSVADGLTQSDPGATTSVAAGTRLTGGALDLGGGTLAVGIDGTAAGQFGLLHASGDVSLGGTLALQPSAAYAGSAADGDRVRFATFDGDRTGAFGATTATPPLAGGRTFTAAYAAGAVDAVVGQGTAAPANTMPPVMLGRAAVGERLQSSQGTWSGAPAQFAYQWLQCDASGDGCTPIGGATTDAYTIKGSDAGHTLRVEVTATNASGSASATSAPSAYILGIQPSPTPAPTPAPAPAPAPAATVTLAVPAHQSPVRSGRLRATVGCAAACSVRALAAVTIGNATPFTVRSSAAKLSAGGSRSLTLAFSKAQQRRLRSALKAHRKVTATVRVDGSAPVRVRITH